ncbi:MAG: AtpZ/AtpI family protein [Sphingomonadaceae bacterium]|nr:AtpZ/AtpI family protein [Sphingomonadaceae bacterium]
MTEDETGQDPGDRQDARFRSLDEQLRSARTAEAARTGTERGKPGKGYSQGSKVLSELVAGLAGGALIGWVLDRFLGTSPWLLLLFLFLGVGVAFRAIMKISGETPE